MDHDEDVADIAQAMRESGASEEAVEQFIEQSRADDEDLEQYDVHVLPANIPTYDTFLACQWQRVVTPDGHIVPIGISSEEIQSTANMLGVPASERAAVLHGVRVMESVAGPQLRIRNQ